jgi:hypothetical protein
VPVLKSRIRRRILGLPLRGLPSSGVNNDTAHGRCLSQLLVVAKFRGTVHAWQESDYAGVSAAVMPASSTGPA